MKEYVRTRLKSLSAGIADYSFWPQKPMSTTFMDPRLLPVEIGTYWIDNSTHCNCFCQHMRQHSFELSSRCLSSLRDSVSTSSSRFRFLSQSTIRSTWIVQLQWNYETSWNTIFLVLHQKRSDLHRPTHKLRDIIDNSARIFSNGIRLLNLRGEIFDLMNGTFTNAAREAGDREGRGGKQR